MTKVHCELFPGCMEVGQNATIPVCGKHKCPGRAAQEFSAAFVRAVTSRLDPQSDEDNEIADMQAYLWAAGVCIGDAEFAAKQLYRQGFRIIKATS